MRTALPIVATAGLLLTSLTAWAAEVPLSRIVPTYIGDGLETAIVPTPKRTDLADSAVELSAAPLCVAPAVLVKGHKLLSESDLRRQRDELPGRAFANARDRRRAWAGFKRQWSRLATQAAAEGWPSPLGFAAELEDLFPNVELAGGMPARADRPVLVLLAGDNDDLAKQSALLGLPTLPEVADPLCAQERYVLSVRREGDRTIMAIRGATPWATLWGLQTLRQMVFRHDGKSYVRLGTVRDWPTLWFRGGKRCNDWWIRYKGNGRFENWPFEFDMRHLPRSHSGVVWGKPHHLERHKKALASAVKAGAGCFLLDFNDGRFFTPDAEGEPFPGDPARTVKYLFEELRKQRQRLGSDIRLGYMGVAYTVNRGADREGEQLRKVEALDGVDFVMMNGLEVFCDRFPAAAAAAYREAFGVDCKLMMYDCQGCIRLLRTPDYKDPEVYKHLHGISAQKSSPIFFIGLADYTWNPQVYDPARSLKLACRELADGDPAFYQALYDYVSFYIANHHLPKALPRAEMIARYETNTREMLARLAKVRTFCAEGRTARLTELAAEIARPVEARAAGLEMTRKLGFKEYRVQRAADITVDGKLDEPAWTAAPKMDRFFPPAGVKGLSDKLLPEGGRAVVARVLYDGEAMYLGYEAVGADLATMKVVREALGENPPEIGPKVAPVFELFIKTDLAKTLRWQIMHFVPDRANSFVLYYFDPADPLAGNRWEHHPTVRTAVTGENSYSMEIRVPFWKEITPPRVGDVWGVQVQLNRVLGGRKTPYWLYHWTFGHNHNGIWAYEYPYGRWIFE